MKIEMSGSFLSEVLLSAEEAEIKDLNISIDNVSMKVQDLKTEVKKVIEETCHLLPSGNEQLVSQAEKLKTNMKNIYERIENQHKFQLQNSTGELKRLSEILQETNLSLQFVTELIDIDVALQTCCELQAKGEYLKAAERLRKLESFFQTSHEQELEIIKALSKERILYLEKFLYDLREIWKLCINISETEVEKNRQILLKVNISRLNDIEQMMKALDYLEKLEFSFKKLATLIQKSILEPVILNECFVETFTDEKHAVLEIQMKGGSSRPNYKLVFRNLMEIFCFLEKYLNVEINKNFFVLNKLGDMICAEFTEYLIKNSLSHTIPSHSEEFADYDNVIKAVEEFQEYVIKIGFFKDTANSILNYAKNVDVLFANKTCETYLAKAREIMKQDLHEMIEVGPWVPSQTLHIDSVNTAMDLLPDFKLSKYSFQFPQCKISKSTQDVLKIVFDILEEATQRTDFCAVRLFYTARNVFELYRAVVPTYHAKFLETIPQQVALFHNNCMYLAHHLLTLGHSYRDRLPKVLGSHFVTFVDQVPKLRELGGTVFLKYMQSQRKQILEILRSSGLTNLGEKCKQDPNVEKSIRQCLRQLELLQKVWNGVLPTNVYCKSIGCLVNAFIEEIITRILTIEDIPAETAVMLVRVFGLVTARAPQVFQDPKEVVRYVKLWLRFQELAIVLGENLKGIEARWCDGKGPLAHYFAPAEVKKLIRALFQNTDRRSAVLAHIK
ncbi:centromere/kinetochore protein zw10 homolog isoform X1 [Schistocerca piceifrons]|uniref:centromere/kinetochore protein zw10 homolog isoform X1 n=1 Tax=Schistocerca piceifrons TaxID=274613 RepID=UPI001F5F1EEA|nr:centromere/kinetochore protein zw10 homolog isoform X1 [Schistocerca piceifrons]